MKEYKSNMSHEQVSLFGEASPSGRSSSKPLALPGRTALGQGEGSLPPYTRLLELYEREFIDQWYISKDSRAKYFADGKVLLKNFYDRTVLEQPKVLLVEEFFRLPLGNYHFVGKIDRADSLNSGVRIIDYKTGKLQKKHDVDQLTIYQWATESMEFKPEALSYWYLEPDEFVDIPLATPEKIEALQVKLLDTIEQIVQAIQTDSFAEIDASLSGHTCNWKGYK